ncbi:MAG: dTDP-glucose 4,6-dehydratase [Abditibacteriota bacterium]|nr:dTDP-glucose 4,6-dehydratase [Abditibacteriota bacterium]
MTGGAGFIGSNFVHLLRRERPEWHVVVLDKLTYAGRPENLAAVANDAQYRFVQGDICDAAAVADAMQGCTLVFNFAAESHVDRSLMGDPAHAGAFVQTDVYGVYVLLEEAKRQNVKKFVQVSTDEVYGDVSQGHSVETDPLEPRSPYSASKAGGELIARSYFVSHDMPVVITRGSNTFGPYQYPEKLLPLFVSNALDDQDLPLYGDGLQRRDWLFVEDHGRGILAAGERGRAGEAYNIGGGNEKTNREVTEFLLQVLGKPASLIKPVGDRPGHDRRYALNCEKAKSNLDWQPLRTFEEAMTATVEWYRDHQDWWRAIKGGEEYQQYYQRNYGTRDKG